MKMTDCWIECEDGHTAAWAMVNGYFPLLMVHLDKWPIGEIDRQYRESFTKWPSGQEVRDERD
ncbi:hypothetical protein [Lacticaseibacillus salsurivasis]|uniref:hypothetical protein n=1 Tax=Lacticaseibacillus salsurivasis TaxID=3081441 RepID=UPI0030C7756C